MVDICTVPCLSECRSHENTDIMWNHWVITISNSYVLPDYSLLVAKEPYVFTRMFEGESWTVKMFASSNIHADVHETPSINAALQFGDLWQQVFQSLFNGENSHGDLRVYPLVSFHHWLFQKFPVHEFLMMSILNLPSSYRLVESIRIIKQQGQIGSPSFSSGTVKSNVQLWRVSRWGHESSRTMSIVTVKYDWTYWNTNFLEV